MNEPAPGYLPRLLALLSSRYYWLLLAFTGVAMEAVALYYQYVIGDEPCQICIHIRIWVAAFTLLSLAMLVLPRRRLLQLTGQLLALVCMIGLWERSWYLLNIENGHGQGSCEYFLGFPDWFALDKWFPALFEVRNLCGFTPEMLFGITMAQGMIAASTGLVVLAVAGIVGTLAILKDGE